jgi:hypothetical protein
MRYWPHREPAGSASGLSRDGGGANVARPRSPAFPGFLVAVAIASAMLPAGLCRAGDLEVRVEEQSDAIHLKVRDVPLGEVLDALQAKLNLRYRTDDTLDKPISGDFNGPLRRVVARMLDGHDYAIKIMPQGIDVLVLRQNAPGNIVIAQAVRVRPKVPAAPVMTAQEANRYERGLAR